MYVPSNFVYPIRLVIFHDKSIAQCRTLGLVSEYVPVAHNSIMWTNSRARAPRGTCICYEIGATKKYALMGTLLSLSFSFRPIISPAGKTRTLSLMNGFRFEKPVFSLTVHNRDAKNRGLVW